MNGLKRIEAYNENKNAILNQLSYGRYFIELEVSYLGKNVKKLFKTLDTCSFGSLKGMVTEQLEKVAKKLAMPVNQRINKG
jgi:hypothetical protein